MSEKKKIRIWTDGCFDMVHFGHANALRQAKLLGDELYVGIHTDEEIAKHKGPPVYSEQERYKLARAIKWVDKVIEAAPYVTTIETLDEYSCDFCAHGDDITTSADGVDTYHIVKKAGRYKEFSRTVGVSTTDLVGRMLLATRTHHKSSTETLDMATQEAVGSLGSSACTKSPYTGTSCFLATTQRIIEFSEGQAPKPGDRIVYTVGAFDLFHVGHVEFLEKAAQLGDYLIVGLLSDQDVNWYKGMNYPIMNIYERTLSVLACRYVNNVMMGAPYVVTQEMLKHFKIDVVVHGAVGKIFNDEDGEDPFRIPRELGIFKIIQSGSSLTSEGLINRIIENRKLYEERNRKKEMKEVTYLQEHQS